MKFKYEPGEPWEGYVIVDLEERKDRKAFAKKIGKAKDDVAEDMLEDYVDKRVLELDLVHLETGEKFTKENYVELLWSSDGGDLHNSLAAGLLKGFPLGKTSRLKSSSK